MTKTKHNNKESVAKCPVDECDHEGLSRGMHLHVRQSSGGGHGPNGDVPDHITFDNLEQVGEKSVEMNYPDERETEQDVVRLCPYCGKPYKGYQGVTIHLGQKRGVGVHPEDAEISKEDCPIAHVDEDMNVIEVVEEGDLMPTAKRRIGDDDDVVAKEEVIQLIESFENDGQDEVADRIRSELL